ncbi:MAG: hypothetical protein Q4G47_02340 [Lachnospiraceae bacterium]|nr:hypothetical protein [Lachnospiraceae bacterium]
MDRAIYEVLKGSGGNYIIPVMCLRGEEGQVIRREMEKIRECGAQAVCLDGGAHPDYMGSAWWRDFENVLRMAKQLDMKVWIRDDAVIPEKCAGGPAYAAARKGRDRLCVRFFDVTGPLAHAALHTDRVINSGCCSGTGQIISVVAMRMSDGDTVTEDTSRDRHQAVALEAAEKRRKGKAFSYERPNRMILTEYIEDGKLLCDFPEGVWRVFVVYAAPDAETCSINPIDKASVSALIENVYEPFYAGYHEEFGKSIAGFYTGGRGCGSLCGSCADADRGREAGDLPWSDDITDLLAEQLGDSWADLMPLLWFRSRDERQTAEVRCAYMNAVSILYMENFSERIGLWCRERGAEFAGYVSGGEGVRPGSGAGHYFRAMKGRGMAGIDNTGGQIVPGNPDTCRHGRVTEEGPFYHYVASKMGASAALMQPEKDGRLVCETFGGYGWGFGVRDMKWVADWLIARGVNRLVPRTFSMQEYPDGCCQPQLYAGGMNPEFPYFARLMRYCSRLCHVFSGGKWIPEVGLLYHGEMEWMDDCMTDQVPARALHLGHIDYAIVPSDALSDAAGCGDGSYPAEVRDGKLVIGGVPLKLLIVPRARYADPQLVRFTAVFPEVRIIYVDDKPEPVMEAPEGAEAALSAATVVPLKELVSTIKSMGVIGARADVRGEASFFHYEKESGDLWMVFNESRSESINGNLLVKMNAEDKLVWRYDAMRNRIYPVEQLLARGFDEPRMLCTLRLDPYESAVFFTATADEVSDLCEERDPGDLTEVMRKDISEHWTVTVADPGDEPVFRPISADEAKKLSERLVPVSDILPEFSGLIRYKREINADDPSGYYVVEAEHLYEVGRVFVNGKETDFRLCPPYRFELGNLRSGKNVIEIETAATPQRDVAGRTGDDPGFVEPTGMFGRVCLIRMEM